MTAVTASRRIQTSIIALFHILVLTVPFTFTWVNEELFEFNKMVLTYGLTLTIGCLWVVRMVLEKRWIAHRTPLDWLIGLFVASQVLSTLFSIHPATSLYGYYTRFHGGLLSTWAYVVLYYALVSNLPAKHVPRLLLSTFIGALGVSLYAIPERFGHSTSCWLITGGESFGVDCWIQDVKNRVFATFGQPNWLAAYAITLIPVALSQVWEPLGLDQTGKNSPSWGRWVLPLFYGLTALGLVLTLLYTQSRSGLLGFLVGLVIWVVLGIATWWLRPRSNSKTTSKAWGSLTPVALTVALIAVLLLVVPNPVHTYAMKFWPQASHPTPSATPEPTAADTAPVVNHLDTSITDSGEIRQVVWEGAWKVFQRYPLLGSGVETFAYSYYQDRPMAHNLVSEWDFLYNKAHNEFLNFLSTTGAVGFLAYCALTFGTMLWLVRIAWLHIRDRQGVSSLALLAISVTAGLIALAISNFFGFSTVMVTILYFLLPALVVVSHQSTELYRPVPARWLPPQLPANSGLAKFFDGKLQTKEQESLSGSQYVGVGVTLGVLLIGLLSVWSMWRADYAYAQGKQLLRAGQVGDGLTLMEEALRLSPNEALFYDELSTSYAQIAASLAAGGDPTTSGQIIPAAIMASDKAMELNLVHLNFYKSRARVFIYLSQIDPKYLETAKATLETAITKAPTDPKLRYNLALVELSLGQDQAAENNLTQTVEMKPNYEAARLELAKYWQQQQQPALAAEQYRYIVENIAPNNLEAQAGLASTSAQVTK